MFCPNCGTNLPDGAAFCAGCGSRIPQEPTPVAQAPVYQPPVQEPPVYAPPVPPIYGNAPIKSKSEWLKTQPSPKAKQMSMLSLIFTAACALILILALCIALFGPFYNIPIFQIALGDDYADQVADLKDELDEAEDGLEWFEDYYGDRMDEDELEEAYKLTKTLIQNPSLGNCRAWADAFNDNSSVQIFDIFMGVLWVSFGFVILLVVLGGLLKKTGLVITALVFSIPTNLLYGGVLFLLLTVAAMVMLAIVLSKINEEYKAYKATPAPVYNPNPTYY